MTNGFVVFIPVMVWNLIFADYLPLPFQENQFNIGISNFILIGENVFRLIIFTMPFLLKLQKCDNISHKGVILFTVGVFVYFSSWLMLMYFPNSNWSLSLVGFTAPAFTPIIWLVGFSFMADGYYFNWKYSKWHFIIPSIIFSLFHIFHTITVFKQI